MKFKRSRIKIFSLASLIISSLCTILIACGNEAENPSNTQSTLKVDSTYELGICSNDRNGEAMFVRQENDYYICMNERWSRIYTNTQTSSNDAIIPSSSASFNNIGISSSFTGEAQNSNRIHQYTTSSSSITIPSSSSHFLSCVWPDSLVDNRDMQKYRALIVGSQTWMAENLNYADSNRTPSLKGHSWCYDNKSENCQHDPSILFNGYGRLYTWDVAVDICPNGWHLPSEEEWQTLLSTFNNCPSGTGQNYYKLKSSGGMWHWPNNNASDLYHFSITPSGQVYESENHSIVFSGQGDYTFFWTSTCLYSKTSCTNDGDIRTVFFGFYDISPKNYESIFDDGQVVSTGAIYKHACSVRCIKN